MSDTTFNGRISMKEIGTGEYDSLIVSTPPQEKPNKFSCPIFEGTNQPPRLRQS